MVCVCVCVFSMRWPVYVIELANIRAFFLNRRGRESCCFNYKTQSLIYRLQEYSEPFLHKEIIHFEHWIYLSLLTSNFVSLSAISSQLTKLIYVYFLVPEIFLIDSECVVQRKKKKIGLKRKKECALLENIV